MTDDPTFEAFYRENFGRVVLGLRLAPGPVEDAGEAEDVAQEAFARTLARWTRVRKGPNPLGYVYRVAFRLQRRRRLVRRRHHDAARLGSLGPRPGATTAEAWNDGAVLRDALRRLPPACARAAVLCLLVEMTAPEAAAVLGVSASTIRTQVQRARQALAAALACDLEDDDADDQTSSSRTSQMLPSGSRRRL